MAGADWLLFPKIQAKSFEEAFDRSLLLTNREYLKEYKRKEVNIKVNPLRAYTVQGNLSVFPGPRNASIHTSLCNTL